VVSTDDEARSRGRRSQFSRTQHIIHDQSVTNHTGHVAALNAARAAVTMATSAGAPSSYGQSVRETETNEIISCLKCTGKHIGCYFVIYHHKYLFSCQVFCVCALSIGMDVTISDKEKIAFSLARQSPRLYCHLRAVFVSALVVISELTESTQLSRPRDQHGRLYRAVHEFRRCLAVMTQYWNVSKQTGAQAGLL